MILEIFYPDFHIIRHSEAADGLQVRKDINSGGTFGLVPGQIGITFRIPGDVILQPFLFPVGPDAVRGDVAVIVRHYVDAVHFPEKLQHKRLAFVEKFQHIDVAAGGEVRNSQGYTNLGQFVPLEQIHHV